MSTQLYRSARHRSAAELAEMKAKIKKGEWAVGGRDGNLTHFWPADYGTSLCGTTVRRGVGEMVHRCNLCIVSYNRITSLDLPVMPMTVISQVQTLRLAITEFIHWMREWDDPDPAVMTQALWLLNLAGVANSGVHEDMKLRVLALMRDLARGDVAPEHALELLKGWEDG